MKHDELFDEYVAELEASKAAAEEWWKSLLANERTKRGDDAGHFVKQRWPFGPASHPWVIRTFRKYYLACEELNQQIEGGESATATRELPHEEDWGQEPGEDESPRVVPPHVFTIARLENSDTMDLFEFIQFLAFIPIGLKNDVSV